VLPTLKGRWETRLVLLVLIGLPVTAWWSWYLTGNAAPTANAPYLVLFTIFVIGAALDPVYILMQRFRWDRDWPFAFQLLSMTCEFILALAVISAGLHPYLRPSSIQRSADLRNVTLHYASILGPSFLALLGPIQIFLVRWRYKGGELGRL
jgi:hypothetical protein